MLSVFYGLLSALVWGAGDFTGGLAARKVGSRRSVFYAEVVSILFLLFMLIFFKESFPNARAVRYAMLAGVIGVIGLMLLYHAMAIGLMSVAAPVSALLSAIIPAIFGMFNEGLPSVFTLIGFGFALFAVWMISQSNGGVEDIFAHLADLKLPLLSGIGFGLYFVFIHKATDGTSSTLWPLVFSRCGGLILTTLYLLSARASLKMDASALPVISANGMLDLGGNFFFILADRAGRLDVASVLSSLYPGSTVLFASIFLKERLTRNQWVGVGAALIAIVLITL